jgi:two-component system, LytTR family, response regulator
MSETSLRVLLVDDEESARALLREYLAAETGITIAGECANGFEAVKAVAGHRPDLLFLDVQMPKLSGFEVLELVAEMGEIPAVIFTTAWDQYALQAFEVYAVDYLLKPFSAERFGEALERARERIARGDVVPAAPLARSVRVDKGKPYLDRLLLRDGPHIRVIPVEQLDYAEARDDEVLLVASGEKHAKPQTLGDLESQLDPARFVRIHRSYLLNVERLERLDLYAKDSRVALLRGGVRLPVSRSGYARLKELL